MDCLKEIMLYRNYNTRYNTIRGCEETRYSLVLLVLKVKKVMRIIERYIPALDPL